MNEYRPLEREPFPELQESLDRQKAADPKAFVRMMVKLIRDRRRE
jgi:hypothetical protein